MLIRLIAAAVDRRSFFVESRILHDGVAVTLNVSVKVGDILRYERSPRVVPGTVADTVACIDSGLIPGRGRAEVSTPGAISAPGSGRQRLTMGIGARKATQIRALSESCTRHEKAHRLRRPALSAATLPSPARRGLLSEQEVGSGHRHDKRDEAGE